MKKIKIICSLSENSANKVVLKIQLIINILVPLWGFFNSRSVESHEKQKKTGSSDWLVQRKNSFLFHLVSIREIFEYYHLSFSKLFWVFRVSNKLSDPFLLKFSL